MWRLIIIFVGVGLIVGLLAYGLNNLGSPTVTPGANLTESENSISDDSVATDDLVASSSVDLLNLDKQSNMETPANNIADKTKTPPPNKMLIDTKKNYVAVIHTSIGDMSISLNAATNPITVNNFVYLAKLGFYDNTIFHRVIEGFMIQGGDPRGDGTGGPGYKFADEPFTGEYDQGTVAMANAGSNTNGSQFFIMHEPQALPKNYVIFGKIQSGLDILDKIATAPVSLSDSGEMSKPVTPIVVKTIDIVEK